MTVRRPQRRSDRGAAAVELALVLPLLVMLLLGIVEFGRGYNAQLTLNAAVREGARALALGTGGSAGAAGATRAAAPALDTSEIEVTSSSSPCTPGQPVTVTATYPFSYSIPLFHEGEFELSSTAVMRCAG